MDLVHTANHARMARAVQVTDCRRDEDRASPAEITSEEPLKLEFRRENRIEPHRLLGQRVVVGIEDYDPQQRSYSVALVVRKGASYLTQSRQPARARKLKLATHARR